MAAYHKLIFIAGFIATCFICVAIAHSRFPKIYYATTSPTLRAYISNTERSTEDFYIQKFIDSFGYSVVAIHVKYVENSRYQVTVDAYYDTSNMFICSQNGESCVDVTDYDKAFLYLSDKILVDCYPCYKSRFGCAYEDIRYNHRNKGCIENHVYWQII